MTNELILRILINMHSQEEADNAFQYIHNHWLLSNEGWHWMDTMVNLRELIKTLDRPEESKLMHYLLSSKLFKEQM